jgi:hypothetical protein
MGRLNNQVGEAQRSLAGAKVEQYLQMIAASTQGMAEVGLRVNQGDFLNFQSRMHTTSGSLGRRAHMMRGLAIPRIGGQLMQAQMGARSQLAAPFAGMGQMAVMATALQNSSSLMGAMQHVEEMARGGPETTLDAIRNIFPGMAAEGLMGLGIDSDSAGAMAGGLTGGGGSPRPRRRSRDDLTMAAKAHEFSNVGILKALNLSNAKLSGMMTTLKFIHDTLEARL